MTERMKKVELVVGVGPNQKVLGLNGLGPHAEGMCQFVAASSRGLRVGTMVDRLAARGITFPTGDPRQAGSNLANRLVTVGAFKHPRGAGGSVRYIQDAEEIWFRIVN